ncbi:hypothetical protein BIZ78_gp203 [Erwinia phage vB_EamM_Caitlin]|uniref:hypothetical protein n=1 Tax=Erwinia phage vB_EamM_Caitlin TaxID=1883379 RepID=UPI00081C67F7|nr:hypothetical protein BIZ78_gp203 [Erwinia phage vB_EamM_Caitlin]ANZ48372.1 hypothetical protein CAITLIN_77 [Erwinia phage vB_EamM_Caitlin]
MKKIIKPAIKETDLPHTEEGIKTDVSLPENTEVVPEAEEYEEIFVPLFSPHYARIFGTTEDRQGKIHYPPPPSNIPRETRDGVEGIVLKRRKHK